MPYIYLIENKINGKQYVGKTLKSIEERWKEHCKESGKTRSQDRVLYRAFNKYGIENFSIAMLEEVSSIEEVNEKEVEWIEVLGTFKEGYNMTQGGDGKHYLDYDLIFSLFEDGKNIKEISDLLNHDPASVKRALEIKGVTAEERKKRGYESIKKSVAQLDIETEEIINVFPSIQEAYEHLGKRSSGHIAAVCNGKRKSIYGYKWKFL